MSLWHQRFGSGAPAVRRARHAVRERLNGELSDRRLSDVELIVSELATNSVRHAGNGEHGEISVEAHLGDECVRLRLCDHGHGFEEPVQPEPRADGAGGYGLVLLDRLSDRWGVQRDGAFCVWFEVARSSHA
jgi:anti-sigma regulatory factor (Ser/Thr protein kinase)